MDQGITTLIVALVGAGGLAGGLVALLKVRPESGRMIVEAAEGAVVVQSGVISALREELGELAERLDGERVEREELKRELDEARVDEDKCQRRCSRLEAELRDVRATLKRHGINGEAGQGRPPATPPSAA